MGQILRACAKCAAPFKPRHARNRWCPSCEESYADSARSPTTRTRPSSSTERERIRQEVLARDPTCQLRIDAGCTGVSTVADHVVAAEHGGRYTLDNLRGACDHCNSVRGGQQPSALEHGHADGNAGSLTDGGNDPAPVHLPTRLA